MPDKSGGSTGMGHAPGNEVVPEKHPASDEAKSVKRPAEKDPASGRKPGEKDSPEVPDKAKKSF